MKKIITLFFVFIGLIMLGGCKNNTNLITERKAIEIAEKEAIKIYGKESVNKEKPFKAVLNEEIWTVSGTLSKNKLGGVVEVKISEKDGKIIEITHGK